jgi:bla regulator protein BlaR1
MTAYFAFGVAGITPSHAQILHPTTPLPAFEVATIKPWKATPLPPSADGAPKKVMKASPVGVAGQATERVHSIGQVEILLDLAYNLPVGSRGRIIGAPDWVASQSDRYELVAKIEASLFATMQTMTPAQQRDQVALMEQSLLADRFHLKLHFESREMPVYALVLAKGGPKLTAAENGEASRLSNLENEQGSEMTARAVTLDELSRSPLLRTGGRPVIDQTGLKGTYNFTLKWRADQSAAQENTSDAPSLFTAIEEQLGLKLVPSKAPIEVIVIDHIERPSEN